MNFDPSRLYSILLSYWRDYYGDREQLVRYWDALLRVLDDEFAQIEQIDDAANVMSCPAFTYHTYLHRELEDWQSYGLPHLHYRNDFRATAAQTTFYLGAWPELATLQVFVAGKETDVVDDPYIVSYEQDGTQPSINPNGARLIFESPRVLNTPVSVFSDKELYHDEIEVTASGLMDITFPAVLDPHSVRVILKKLKMYEQPAMVTTLVIDDTIPAAPVVSWYKAVADAPDDRVFRAGERYEIRDGTSVQTITIEEDTTEFTIGPAVPATTIIYKLLDLEITDGRIDWSGYILRANGQTFPVSMRVRAEDEYGSEGIETTSPVDSVEFSRSFNDPKIFAYGSEILNAYTVDENELTFTRSFQDGMVVIVEAAFFETNDHAEYHETVAAITDSVSVPITRPFALTPLLLEDPHYPIQLFVNGVLLHPDKYTFPSTTTIKLNLPLIFMPGTVLDIYYVDKEDPIPHAHTQERFFVDITTKSFHLTHPASDRFSQYVNVSGTEVSNPDSRWFTPDGNFLNFFYPPPFGSIVKVRGARRSKAYWHTIDAEVVQAGYLQDGIDERSTLIPAGWTNQLAWDVDFSIEDGILDSNVVIEDAWFKDVLIDEKTGYNNFGQLIDFNRETSEEYMSILRAVYAGSYMGSQPQTIENFVNIIMGSEYLENPATVDSVDNLVVTAGGETYTADSEVPVRVRAKETYERFYAISSFAEVIDRWTGFDLISIMAEDFSDDYKFAKNLDKYDTYVYTGGAATYDRQYQKIDDTNEDFFTWEVWPGDLIAVYSTGAPTIPIYGRVSSVEQNSLGIQLDLGTVAIGYGEGWFGQYTYGGTSTEEQVDHYKVWARKTRRLDTYEFIDQARAEEIPYLVERFQDVLGKFVFLVRMNWKGLRSGQALEDVAKFLDRSKPGDTRYIGYTEAYDDEGLTDVVTGDLTDTEPVREVIGDFLFTTNSNLFGGRIGEDGQIAPNLGSFIDFAPVWVNVDSCIFDGVDEFVDTFVNTDLSGSGAFSVFCWVKSVAVGNQFLVCQANTLGPYASDWILGYQNGGLWFQGLTIDGGNTVFDGAWHSIGFTFDGVNASLYIDGALFGVPIAPVGFGGVGTVKLMTRGDATTIFTPGNLDEVSIWDIALTLPEITELHNGGAPADLDKHSASLNILHWYQMGDGDVFPTLIDHGGSKNATMVNMEIGDIVADVPP